MILWKLWHAIEDVIGGARQDLSVRKAMAKVLYKSDKTTELRRSQDNPYVQKYIKIISINRKAVQLMSICIQGINIERGLMKYLKFINLQKKAILKSMYVSETAVCREVQRKL